jgi:hypothetical protein
MESKRESREKIVIVFYFMRTEKIDRSWGFRRLEGRPFVNEIRRVNFMSRCPTSNVNDTKTEVQTFRYRS